MKAPPKATCPYIHYDETPVSEQYPQTVTYDETFRSLPLKKSRKGRRSK